MLRLGVDLGGTKIEAALVEDSGACVLRRRLPVSRDYLETLDAIADLVTKVEREAGLSKPLPVGLCHPGSLSPRTGLMRHSNLIALNGRPLDQDLSRRLNRAVRCANDANCFALSEARDGAAAGALSMFGVIAGTGVGGGLVLNGRLVRGADASAGEWGHMALPYLTAEERAADPARYCGRSGCVEAWCSGPALSRDHERQTGRSLSAPEIAAAAKLGDKACQLSLDRHADRFARALTNVIKIVDPEVIVLGGGLSNLDGFADTLAKRLPHWLSGDDLVARIRTPLHGDSSGVRGAAWLWDDN